MTNSIKTIFRHILSEQTYNWLRNIRNRGYMFINPKGCISMLFRSILGYEMSWKNPQDLNEKINWMKLYSDTSEWTLLGDKYRVREYLIKKGYQELLVPLIGKWDHVEDINWETLPEQFVMKMNNGSGDILICTDKSQIDIEYWKKKFKKLFKIKFGITMGEKHYSKMKPCIIAEKLLDSTKQSFCSTSLIDYKLWCFDGEVTYIYVCYNRNKETINVALYDKSWIAHPEHCVSTSHCIKSKTEVPRPHSLSQMIKVATDLSKGFPQVRIDFYEIDGKPYFGEMTFTSNSGYMDYFTRSFMMELGKKVKL